MRYLLILAAALAGCSAEPTRDPAPSPTPAASGSPSSQPQSLALRSLSGGDQPTLPGELRCGLEDEAGEPLLAAAANVGAEERATALVSLGGNHRLLAGTTTGGFNALTRGGSFTGGGLTATIARGAREETGHEGTRHRATLEIADVGGARAIYRGWWVCGP